VDTFWSIVVHMVHCSSMSAFLVSPSSIRRDSARVQLQFRDGADQENRAMAVFFHDAPVKDPTLRAPLSARTATAAGSI
jgi:hypothetical protein